jgi:hypothetical protein
MLRIRKDRLTGFLHRFFLLLTDGLLGQFIDKAKQKSGNQSNCEQNARFF